jgi:hypothetical protein
MSQVVYFAAALSLFRSFRCAVAPGSALSAWLGAQAGREGCDGSRYVVGPALMLEAMLRLGRSQGRVRPASLVWRA